MFFIYLSEQVRGIELGFKQFLTLQTSVIPVVPTQLFMSLAFYKFSRMLLSWHLRTSTPQPRNGNVPNEMQSENTKKYTRKGMEKKEKQRERESRQTRVAISLLLIPSSKETLLMLPHDFCRNISAKTLNPCSVSTPFTQLPNRLSWLLLLIFSSESTFLTRIYLIYQ